MSELVPVGRGGVVAAPTCREVEVKAWWKPDEIPLTSCIPFAAVPEPISGGLRWRIARRLLIEGFRFLMLPALGLYSAFYVASLGRMRSRLKAPEVAHENGEGGDHGKVVEGLVVAAPLSTVGELEEVRQLRD